MRSRRRPVLLDEIRERSLREMAKLPEQIGRYEIRGELGRGGMGIVYQAFDATLERTVAIKVIHRDRIQESGNSELFVRRFEREMRATSEIFHSNVVAVLDAGTLGAGEELEAYYVMEWVDGETLEERLQEHGPLPRHEGLALAAAVARGLAAANARGLVHRDLKPSNVLLPRNGDAKVADFGLCRLRSEVQSGPGTNSILGSAHYIAPEQISGGEVDGRADLFSLGAILIRMFSGVEPFHAEHIAGHLHRILHDDPDGTEGLDADIRDLVKRLMAKHSVDRPETATQVAEEIEAMQESERTGPARLLPRARPAKRATPQRSLVFQFVTAVALTLFVSLGLLGWARINLATLDESAIAQRQSVENQLTRQRELLPRLTQLAATAQGESLAYEVAGAQNRLAVERGRYNETVARFNRRLSAFPWKLVAGSYRPHGFLRTDSAASSR